MSGDIYNSLRFEFKLDFINVDYDAQFELRNRNGDWIPPTRPEGVTRWATTGWVRWAATNMTRGTSMGSPDVQVCSLFYNSETCSFLGVPYDCREKSVEREKDSTGLGWRRLMFDYTDDAIPLSVIGFDLQYHVLAARGSSSWMPELVPPTYNHNQERLHGSLSPRTGLAGDLSILLGMAALSVAPTRRVEEMGPVILNVLGTSFRPPEWRRHNLSTGSKII